MSLVFIHTADWHIGKPFGSLPSEQAAKLRGARLDAIEALAEHARAGAASTVLVAGDLFDRPSLADRELRAPLAQMAAHANLVWHVIPGNHDHAAAGGVWERMLRDGLPANVRLHLEARPVQLSDSAWLLPSPLATRSVTDDPTAWMDTAATPAGAIRIGLAHGSVQGFGSDRAASIAIAPDRPRRAALDYLALGDWHGSRRIGPRCWYAGTPEPDGFGDDTQGHALLVTIEAPGATPAVQRLATGTYRWLERPIDAGRRTDLAALEGEIEGMGARARHVLLSVAIRGAVSFEQDRMIRARLEKLDGRVFHLASHLDAMILDLDGDDLSRLGSVALRDLGRELSAAARDASHPDHAVAARALRHLLEICTRLDAEAGRPA
jgi:DNA repair exonuclease SbcCD nuclease subunit